ncbi:MAG: hypothetical protein K2P79_08300, partial [Sphingomonas sp.]|nr:hypothetical protein [Sphingomonas sp.]
VPELSEQFAHRLHAVIHQANRAALRAGKFSVERDAESGIDGRRHLRRTWGNLATADQFKHGCDDLRPARPAARAAAVILRLNFGNG